MYLNNHVVEKLFQTFIIMITLFCFTGSGLATEILKWTGCGITKKAFMGELAKVYQANTGIVVSLSGGGATKGIRKTNSGDADMGGNCRPSLPTKFPDDESDVEMYLVAWDALVPVVHGTNPLNSLTSKQLQDVLTGKITNWKDLGGVDKDIVVVTREASSGTREAFEQIVGLKKSVNGIHVTNITPTALVGNGNGMIKTLVSNNDYAISFISLGSVDDTSLKVLKVNGIESSEENIVSGQYRIARPFIFIFKNNVPQEARDFINYVLSDEGQQIVEQQGYISVK